MAKGGNEQVNATLELLVSYGNVEKTIVYPQDFDDAQITKAALDKVKTDGDAAKQLLVEALNLSKQKLQQ